MPSLSTAPTAHPAHLTVACIDAGSRWVEDDEIVLGCECANPALQIECWGQDDGAMTTLAS